MERTQWRKTKKWCFAFLLLTLLLALIVDNGVRWRQRPKPSCSRKWSKVFVASIQTETCQEHKLWEVLRKIMVIPPTDSLRPARRRCWFKSFLISTVRFNMKSCVSLPSTFYCERTGQWRFVLHLAHGNSNTVGNFFFCHFCHLFHSITPSTSYICRTSLLKQVS